MNIRLTAFAVGIIAMTSSRSDDSTSFFYVYAKSAEKDFKEKYGGFKGKSSLCQLKEPQSKSFSDAQNEEMNSLFDKKRKKESKNGTVKGGGMFGKLFKSDEPEVDQDSPYFKQASEIAGGLNYGQSVDLNKSSAAAQGRRHGVAAGTLFGPANWLVLKCLFNSNNPQVGLGVLVLVNTLGLYNLKAQCTYATEPCLREYNNKKSFWKNLILGSTLALFIATKQVN